MGVLLASPIGDGIEREIGMVHSRHLSLGAERLAINSCTVIRGIEMLCAVAVCFFRIFAVPALVLWVLRAIANIGSSASPRSQELARALNSLARPWQAAELALRMFPCERSRLRDGDGKTSNWQYSGAGAYPTNRSKPSSIDFQKLTKISWLHRGSSSRSDVLDLPDILACPETVVLGIVKGMPSARNRAHKIRRRSKPAIRRRRIGAEERDGRARPGCTNRDAVEGAPGRRVSRRRSLRHRPDQTAR